MTANEAPGQNGVATSGKPRSLPFDTSVAHQARMYDYVLGGKDNFAADREAVQAWLKVDPGVIFGSRANRAFLGRAIRYLAADAGVRQFLDIGTGIPTAGNTHEIAQAVAPESRVVYVDYDPIVLAHARALLSSDPAGVTEYVDADLRDTAALLRQAGEVLDFTRPVAVTLLAVLHAIPDSDNPYKIVAQLMDAVPSGSYLAISHAGSDLFDQQALGDLEEITVQLVRLQPAFRSREQVARFFDGTELVEPGLVRAEEWRPDAVTDTSGRSAAWCAVGRKR